MSIKLKIINEYAIHTNYLVGYDCKALIRMQQNYSCKLEPSFTNTGVYGLSSNYAAIGMEHNN